jgi:hypothetical protein
MKIELKNISYHARLSEETPNYSADLYVDKIKIGYVGNSGQGGCDRFQGDQAAYDLANAWCFRRGPDADDLEGYIGDILDDWLAVKEIKRLIGRGKVLFVAPDDTLRTCSGKGDIRAHIEAKFPGAIIINDLTPALQLKAYRGARS